MKKTAEKHAQQVDWREVAGRLESEITRLRIINREICKLLDEQAAPVGYVKKEVN